MFFGGYSVRLGANNGWDQVTVEYPKSQALLSISYKIVV